MIAAMMSVACEEYIDLRREGPEKMLVVNGNLVAGDTLHTVFLTWGMYDDVKPVESAHLECYVNGKLVASTDKVVLHVRRRRWLTAAGSEAGRSTVRRITTAFKIRFI